MNHFMAGNSATLILGVILGAAVGVSPESCADELGDAVRSAVDRVAPAIVRIRTVGAPDESGRISSRVTTGVAVSAHEVVTSSFGFGEGLAAIFVETADGKREAAEIVAQDDLRRLVLLNTNAATLTAPEWRNDEPPVGAWAVAAGRFYPTTIPSASLGVISAVNRIYGMALQTDAKVSPVNYGGPLITLDGRVAGILVPLAPGDSESGIAAGVEWYDSGIGFAIPARDVQSTVQLLREGRDRRRGLLGITLGTRNPLSTEIRVEDVDAGSPADAAGFRAGDEILRVNGTSVERVGILLGMIRRTAAGERVEFVIRRDDLEEQVTAVLTDRYAVQDPGWLGLVPIETAAAGDDETPVGVLVGILSDSPLAAAGLPSRCVITRVGDEDVVSPAAFRKELTRLHVGTEWTVSWQNSPQDEAVETVTVTAASRPELTPAFLRNVRAVKVWNDPEAPRPEWNQSLVDLDEDTHLWLLSPKVALEGTEPGVVIWFADDEPRTELMLRRWREICEEQRLVLAVVYRDLGLPLSGMTTLASIMGVVLKSGPIDPDRVALVTGETYASLVTGLLQNTRLRSVRHGVFLGCRPVLAGPLPGDLREKRMTALIYATRRTTEAEALLQSTARALREAGGEVTIRQPDESLPPEGPANEIADWLLLQTVR